MRVTLGNAFVALATLSGAGLALAGSAMGSAVAVVAGLVVMLGMAVVMAVVASRRAAAGLELGARLRSDVDALAVASRTDPFRAELRTQLERLRLEAVETRKAQDAVAESVVARTASEVARALHDEGAHVVAMIAEASAAHSASQREAIDGVRRRLSRLANHYEKDKAEFAGLVSDDRRLRDLSRRSMQWLRSEIVREVDATHQLRSLLAGEVPTSLLDGWAMDPVAMLELVQLVLERRPGRVVELGSGASTIWIGHALRRVGAGQLLSFDHLEEFGGKTRARIAEHGLQAQVALRVVDLSTFEHEGEAHQWYDLAGEEALGPIDLLIVDGPPGAIGPHARFPALPALADRLRPDARVVVDDANRSDEAETIRRWMEMFPQLRECAPLGSRTRVFSWSPEVEGGDAAGDAAGNAAAS